MGAYDSTDTTTWPSAGDVISEGPLILRDCGAASSPHVLPIQGVVLGAGSAANNRLLVPEMLAVPGSTAGTWEGYPWNPCAPQLGLKLSIKGRFKMGASPAATGYHQFGVGLVTDGTSNPISASALVQAFSMTETTRDNVDAVVAIIDASGNILSDLWSTGGDATLTDSGFDVDTSQEVEFEAIWEALDGTKQVLTVKIRDNGGTMRTILTQSETGGGTLRAVPCIWFNVPDAEIVKSVHKLEWVAQP